ncbi:MAG: flagellar basal body rod protein FlgB [Oscillospiraceae bacterium]
MWDKLFSTVNGLGKGVDATWLRNEVITNNIANADTPGFKVSEVKFEDVMAQAVSSGGFELKTTRQEHVNGIRNAVGNVEPVVTTDENTSYRSDENNVDAEAQMTALAQNSLEYYTLVNKINSEFEKLNMAISGQ